MADTLCGPSNALQTFQKHSSADRTLQQDRLAFRQSPTQSFRSSPGAGVARAEADFQAFQSGPAASPFQYAPAHQGLSNGPRFAPPALPNWASEFQHLQISGPQAIRREPSFAALRPPAAVASSSWQEEFMKANTMPSANTVSHQPQYRPMAIPTSSQQGVPIFRNESFETMAQSQPIAFSDDQHLQDSFSKEFDLIEQEIDMSEDKGKQKEQVVEQSTSADQEQSMQHVLSHADMEMGDITGDYDYDRGGAFASEDVNVADQLRTLRRDGGWEAVEAYERALRPEMERSNSPLSRDIVETINQLRQEEDQTASLQAQTIATQPEQITSSVESPEVRIGADTIPSSQEQAQPSGPEAEADELAKTAGQLLHNLREEQSSKFQKSNFMELMRQLRDREARIEGENMVSVSVPKTDDPFERGLSVTLKVFQCSTMEG